MLTTSLAESMANGEEGRKLLQEQIMKCLSYQRRVDELTKVAQHNEVQKEREALNTELIGRDVQIQNLSASLRARDSVIQDLQYQLALTTPLPSDADADFESLSTTESTAVESNRLSFSSLDEFADAWEIESASIFSVNVEDSNPVEQRGFVTSTIKANINEVIECKHPSEGVHPVMEFAEDHDSPARIPAVSMLLLGDEREWGKSNFGSSSRIFLDQIASLEANLAEARAQVDVLEEINIDLDTKVAELEITLLERDEEISRSALEIHELQSEVTDVKVDLGRKDDLIQELEEQLSSTLASAEADEEQLEDELDQLQHEIDFLHEKCNAATEMMQEREQKFCQEMVNMQQVLVRQARATAEAEASENRRSMQFAVLRKRFTRLDDLKKALEIDNLELGTKNEVVGAKLRTSQLLIDAIQRQIVDLKGHVESNETLLMAIATPLPSPEQAEFIYLIGNAAHQDTQDNHPILADPGTLALFPRVGGERRTLTTTNTRKVPAPPPQAIPSYMTDRQAYRHPNNFQHTRLLVSSSTDVQVLHGSNWAGYQHSPLGPDRFSGGRSQQWSTWNATVGLSELINRQ
ncbi:hypothetical protein FRC02_002868, partial [Tulasnella sp. 418]